MTKPYSNDLRERVVSAVAAGESCRAVAERFDVAPSSVVKWAQRFRKTGSFAPGKIGSYRKAVLEAHLDFIMGRINARSHLTLHGPQRRTGSTGGEGIA